MRSVCAVFARVLSSLPPAAQPSAEVVIIVKRLELGERPHCAVEVRLGVGANAVHVSSSAHVPDATPDPVGLCLEALISTGLTKAVKQSAVGAASASQTAPPTPPAQTSP